MLLIRHPGLKEQVSVVCNKANLVAALVNRIDGYDRKMSVLSILSIASICTRSESMPCTSYCNGNNWTVVKKA